MSDLRILAWNLNHRATMKTIPPGTIDAIDQLKADVLVLSEYADGNVRDQFKAKLREVGYRDVFISEKIGRQNQVLIACKTAAVLGGIKAPVFDDSSATNFLHVHIPACELSIVGLRCPAYKAQRDLTAYWRELRKVIDSCVSEQIVFIGDFNGDPDGRRSPAGVHLSALRDEGWNVPSPGGD